MALGSPAVLTPKALDLRAVQGTVSAIRERLQFIEQAIAVASARTNSSTTTGDTTALQAQLAQLAARVSSVESAVGGDSEVELIAGTAVAAGDPVIMVGLNVCAPIDVTDPTAIYAVVGLANSAAAIGQPVTVTRWGNFSVADGTLDVGRAVYANEGGGLTQFPSYTDVAVPVGVATGTATMWVSPAWPSLRALGFESGYEDFLPSTVGLVRDAVLLTQDFNATSNGIAVKTGENDVTTRALTGTAARVAVTDGSGVGGNPTVDIDAAYVGQTSITTLGTIATGTWAGTAVAADHGGTGLTSYAVGDLVYASTTTTLSRLADVATGNAVISGGIGAAPSWGKIGLTTHVSGTLGAANGGTGVANAAGSTITLGGALTTSGAFASTFTMTGTTTVTFPTSGTLATTASLPVGANPTASVGLAAVNGVATTFMRSDAAPALSVAISPTWVGTHTFSNTIVGSVNGNAATATALQTARNINGVSFNGTADITVTAAAGTLTGATLAAGVTASSLTSVGTIASGTWAGTAVAADHGGTGITSYAVGDLVYANTTTSLAKLADVATGNAVISGGVGVAPSWGKIGLTTHVSGTLAATNGGTGQSSFAVGDLFYASTTTAISKLAGVATGNALISGGVNTAPSWGKVGLTTHVSGILPVANGGTGSSTAPYVALAGDTMTGDLTISKVVAPIFTLNATANAVQAIFSFETSGSTRWVLRKNNTSETGGNAGSNFGIRRYDDAGVFIEDALLITRSSGNVSIAQALGVSGACSFTSTVAVSDQLSVIVAGKGISIKEGSNAKMGTATMVAGTVTVNTTAVTANSRIMLTPQNASGAAGSVSVTARTAGTSFTIGSTSATDTRLVAWIMFEPA